jgi:preprotein translocase subunit SecB
MNYTIMTQYIKKISSDNSGFLELATSENEPELNVDIRVRAEPIGEDVFESILRVSVTVSSNNKEMFTQVLDYAGIVRTEEKNEDILKKCLLVTIPTLLFPYARCIISNMTRDSGHPPVFLLPVDFAAMYEKNDH